MAGADARQGRCRRTAEVAGGGGGYRLDPAVLLHFRHKGGHQKPVWRQRSKAACGQHHAPRDSRGGQVRDKGRDAIHRAVDCDKHLQFGWKPGNGPGPYRHNGGESAPSFPCADSIPHGAERERAGAERHGDAADRGCLKPLRPDCGKPGGVFQYRASDQRRGTDAHRNLPRPGSTDADAYMRVQGAGHRTGPAEAPADHHGQRWGSLRKSARRYGPTSRARIWDTGRKYGRC